MIARAFNIIADLGFKRQHTLGIHIPCARYKIKCIVVFARKHKSYKMAAVKKILAVYKIVFRYIPPARTDIAYTAAFFGRHQFFAYTGICRAAASKFVKRAVVLKGNNIRIFKQRHIIIKADKRLSRKFGYIVGRYKLLIKILIGNKNQF